MDLGHLPLGAASSEFEQTLALLGGLLVVGALLSGIARRSFLSLTALFVIAGFLLGEGGAEVIDFDPRSDFVSSLAVVALILILFRDGLEVEAEMLQRAWRLPLRKLLLAMPLTGALVALATVAFTDLSWEQGFLLGALLSPTDPVLSSSVVTNSRVPRIVRHSLNLESGLNDGLALAAVVTFSSVLRTSEDDFVWWRFLLQDISLGLLTGLAVGYVASRLMPRGSLERAVSPHEKSLYALGVAVATYGIAVTAPEGNGFIAVFVCAIVLGILRPDIRECFEHRSEDVIEVVKLGIFVVFGALLTLDGLFGDGLAAVAIALGTLLVARPVAVMLSLTGTRTELGTRAFMSWFGPKGVATMAFALIVLGDAIPGNDRIFNIAALTVFISIVAHGLTDHAGANWIAKRSERVDELALGGGGPAPEREPAP